MSKEIAIIPKTGTNDAPLQITEFCGPAKKGIMLQLTQGKGGQDCPGYVELTVWDVFRLLSVLEEWVRERGRGKMTRYQRHKAEGRVRALGFIMEDRMLTQAEESEHNSLLVELWKEYKCPTEGQQSTSFAKKIRLL